MMEVATLYDLTRQPAAVACQEAEEHSFPSEGLCSIPAEPGSSLPLSVCACLAVATVEAPLLTPWKV